MQRRVLGICAAAVLAATGALAEVNDAALMADKPPRSLAELGLFTDMASQTPDAALVPYTLNAPLFTDYATKFRYIYLPEGAEPPSVHTDKPLDFPVGTVLVKSFAYPDGAGGYRPVETRLLIHKAEGWTAYPYVWNENLSDARLKIAGKDIEISVVLDNGQELTSLYHVPNVNQCKGCHIGADGEFTPIGPRTRQLNGAEGSGNQLDRLVAAGVVAPFASRADLPMTPAFSDENVDLTLRARAYLDANCGHCHAPGLPADTSGLYLNWEEDRDIHLGVNKPPVAAGRGSGGLAVDIDPGSHETSILWFRMNSTDPGIMMPELGRSVIDQEGLALIAEFIDQMAN